MTADVRIATCLQLPEVDVDAAPLAAAFARHGIKAELLAWDDPSVDWDLAIPTVLRSTWNYVHHLDEFLTWCDRVHRAGALWNSPAVVRMNVHKGYLLELAARGVATAPTLLVRAGLSNANAASLSGLSSLFGVLGMILVGWLMDKFGAFRVIAGVFLATALALLVIVLAPGNLVVLTIALFAAVAGVDGANIGMFALAASLYDTPIRSTGVGWAIGIGRAGSIMGPIVGGALLGVQFAGYSALFLVYAATALLAGLSVLLLRRAIAGRGHEPITRTETARP